jgi:hypothetical protein
MPLLLGLGSESFHLALENVNLFIMIVEPFIMFVEPIIMDVDPFMGISTYDRVSVNQSFVMHLPSDTFFALSTKDASGSIKVASGSSHELHHHLELLMSLGGGSSSS